MDNRYKEVKLVSILGIILNIFLLIIKGITGHITKSRAMISDAFNSAGDIFSSLMTFIGNKIASKPNDEDHNLGHGKAEYIYSMLISIVMMITSIKVLKDSLFLGNKKIIFSKYLVIVSLITIILKFLMFLFTNKISKKQNNLLLKANSIDHRNDSILTILTLISSLLLNNGIKIIDIIIGSIISIYIFYQAVLLYIESYDVLMDKCISDVTKNKVYDIIKKYPEIIKTNHFNSTPVGYKYQISVTIFVDGNLSTFKSHEIADNLEKEITNSIDEIYLTIIHVNPV